MSELKIKKENLDLHISTPDSDMEIRIFMKDGIDLAIGWLNKQDAIQIINHLKKQFNIE